MRLWFSLSCVKPVVWTGQRLVDISDSETIGKVRVLKNYKQELYCNEGKPQFYFISLKASC